MPGFFIYPKIAGLRGSPHLLRREAVVLRLRSQRRVGRRQPILSPTEEDAVAAVERLGRGNLDEDDRPLALIALDKQPPAGLRGRRRPGANQEAPERDGSGV